MNNEKKFTKRKTSWRHAATVMILIALTVVPSYGATWDYYLQAGVTSIPAGTYNAAAPVVPDENILMWGYQICLDGTYAVCGSPAAGAKMPPQTAADIVAGTPTFPGPVLVASEQDTINIHLRNNITSVAAAAAGFPLMMTEPTSLIMLGQLAALNPSWVSVDANGGVIGITSTGARAAGDVTSRVRSFNAETPADGVTVTTYTWNSLTPGTYLYESGTHPAVQVQMGLYGALNVYPLATPATPGAVPPAGSIAPTYVQAYNDATTKFNSEVTLVFSEIDQELHYSVASGLYGTPPPPPPTPATRGQRTSTFTFAPKFFLINGQPRTAASTAIPAGFSNAKNLIRLVNAGVREKTPTLIPQTALSAPLYMDIIAEDGNPYMLTTGASAVGTYFSKQQYATLLPAGKTMDVIVEPSTTGSLASTVSVFDRSLNLTNSNLSGGGMIASLAFAAGPASPLSTLTLTVTWPTTGVNWKVGSTHKIAWSYSTPPGPVKIDLMQYGQVVQTITSSTGGYKGYYWWTLPTNLKPGTYKARVTSINTNVSAKSAFFTISN